MNIRVEVKRSPIAGRGLFTLQPVKKGALIGEYAGEIVDNREAERRYPDVECILKKHCLLFEISQRRSIDGGVGGNETRFLNHSFTPNVEAVQKGARIFFHALRNIPAKTELTLDYKCPCDECAETKKQLRRQVAA